MSMLADWQSVQLLRSSVVIERSGAWVTRRASEFALTGDSQGCNRDVS